MLAYRNIKWHLSNMWTRRGTPSAWNLDPVTLGTDVQTSDFQQIRHFLQLLGGCVRGVVGRLPRTRLMLAFSQNDIGVHFSGWLILTTQCANVLWRYGFRQSPRLAPCQLQQDLDPFLWKMGFDAISIKISANLAETIVIRCNSITLENIIIWWFQVPTQNSAAQKFFW